jgi:hypothetical protein
MRIDFDGAVAPSDSAVASGELHEVSRRGKAPKALKADPRPSLSHGKARGVLGMANGAARGEAHATPSF